VILVVAVAALLGWFVLRNGFGVGDASNGGSSDAATTTVAEVTTTVPPPTTTLDKASWKNVVANGSGVGGSAGRLTETLAGKGYVMIEPTNANRNDYAVTEIYFVTGFEAQAAEISRELGVPVTGLLPDPSPVPPAGVQDANVVVVLGTDLASQPSVGTTTPPTSSG
jgi:hypothetical protein